MRGYRAGAADGAVDLVCTILQRPLVYALHDVRREGAVTSSFFPMRVNEGEDSADACLERRTTKVRRACANLKSWAQPVRIGRTGDELRGGRRRRARGVRHVRRAAHWPRA